jgi:hypothetical protein
MTYKTLRYCLKTLSKKDAPPTFSHGEGRWGKGLKPTINEGIAITNLTKKNPTHPLHLRGCMGQWITIGEVQYVTSFIMCMRFNICMFVFSCFSTGIGTTFSYSFIIKIIFSKSTSILLASPTNVSPMSSPTCTYSSIISFGANATTSSMLTYAYCPITLAFKSPSFMTLPMPFTNSTKAY